MATLQELLVTSREGLAAAREGNYNGPRVALLAAMYELYTRIMALPLEVLREEAATAAIQLNVLIASCGFPLDAFARLLGDDGVDIDTQDIHGYTAIMHGCCFRWTWPYCGVFGKQEGRSVKHQQWRRKCLHNR
jgi:hypothetical protein